jgi:hypothetical protein
VFQILTELLGYVRKLLPLMELYTARRVVQPMRDPETQEFQMQIAEGLRSNRADLVEMRSTIEGVHQRLRVVDDQSVAIQRELARIADQQRTMMIAVVIAAVSAAGALITAIVAVARR